MIEAIMSVINSWAKEDYIMLLIFPIMLFCHIVDDYYLQGWLVKGKQKKWWEENAPEELYKNDYKAALIAHAFSWSFMIHLPMLVYAFITQQFNPFFFVYIATLIMNTIIHAVIDDCKANGKLINLIADQSIHFLQIFGTFALFNLVFTRCK